jgi:transcriptional regulator with XRE-family HTH domain
VSVSGRFVRRESLARLVDKRLAAAARPRSGRSRRQIDVETAWPSLSTRRFLFLVAVAPVGGAIEYISLLESGGIDPSPRALETLAGRLGISPSAITRPRLGR